MKKKIVLYMSGNYALILKHLPRFNDNFDFIAYCQNYKAYKTIGESNLFLHNFYLYQNFNSIYKQNSKDSINDDINGFKVLQTDKNHFKRISSVKQERVLNTMHSIFQEWINIEKPDYVFIPIIESIDAMLLFEICKKKNIEPIIYSYARHLSASFFSNSYLETLPSFYKKIKATEEQINKTKKILLRLKNISNKLNFEKQLLDLYDSFTNRNQVVEFRKVNVFIRFLTNIRLKILHERRNETLRLWTKFQVYIQKILVPLQELLYIGFEKLYLNPINSLPLEFDYFPLHFSPESSINTPAPYYIDQLRVIDKILLKRSNSNRILVIKEHPAMYLKRNFSFYKEIKKKPFVRIIRRDFDSIELIKKSTKVYSVTGTACMEAFYLQKPWKMLGDNFLSLYFKENKNTSTYDFTLDTLKVSGNFVLYTPPNKNDIRHKTLFSEQNLMNMSDYLNFYVKNLTT